MVRRLRWMPGLSRFFLVVLIGGVLCGATLRTGHAEPFKPLLDSCRIPALRGKMVLFLVDDSQPDIPLSLYPTGSTDLFFDPAVASIEGKKTHSLQFLAAASGVTLKANAQTSGRVAFTVGGFNEGFKLTVGGFKVGLEVGFKLRLVTRPEQAISIGVIRKRTAMDAGKPDTQVIAEHVCQGNAPMQGQLAGVFPAMIDDRVVDEAISDWLLKRGSTVPLHDPMPEDQALGIQGVTALISQDKAYVLLVLRNHLEEPFRLGELKLFGEDRKKNLASLIRIATPDGSKSPASPSEKRPVMIDPKTEVRAVVTVPLPERLGKRATVLAGEPDGGRVVLREDISLLGFTSLAGNDDEVEFKPDGSVVIRPPSKYAGRVTLSAWGSYGAVWLTEDVGANRTAATRLEALGARVTYAFNQYLHAEASAALARSGDAEFQGATLNAMTGDLVRSATLGRLQIGALVRWGTTVLPTMRLGIGVQGASVNADFTPGGGSMMQSSSTEFGVFFSVGAGVDVWLVKDVLLLGTGLFVERVSGAETLYRQSAGAGLHLGYAWKP